MGDLPENNNVIIKQKNLTSIDIARAFAALGVFSYHQHIGFMLAKYSGIKLFNFIDAFGAYYAVPLFFLISGYCIHLSNLKYLQAKQSLSIKKYYKQRLLRIYPPYIIAVIFSIVTNYVIQNNYQINFNDILIHVFLLQGFSNVYFNSINVVLWTITIEMTFYIIYPVFYYLRLKFSLTFAIFFTLLVSSFSIIYISGKGTVTISQQYCVFSLWFAWCCGAYLADKKSFVHNDLKKPFYKLIYLLILMAFIWLNFYNQAVSSIVTYQVNILVWTAPLLILLDNEYLLSTNNSSVKKIFVAIGLSSYSLYLLHEPLINLKNFLVHAFLPQKFQLAGLIIGIFIIPVITWFSYLYIEKPFMLKKRTIAGEK